MVAVIDGDVVIAFGEYTQEDYPNNVLVEITQEQYDMLETFIEPRYNGVKFYDNNFVYVMYEGEKYLSITRIDLGKNLYSEVYGKLRVLMKVELITEQEFDLRISAFVPVRNEILKGDFLLAKELFENIDPQIYGQEMYDEIMGRIDFYITDNYLKYPWENVQQKIFSKSINS